MRPLSSVQQQKPRYAVILRGESVVASLGIGLAAVALLAMGAGGWWTLEHERETAQANRAAQVKSAGEVLAQSTEAMLAGDELTSLRRLVADAARNYQLDVCRVTLADGRVLADGNPARASLAKLPAEWPKGSFGEDVAEGTKFARGLNVTGKGPARLEIEGASGELTNSYWRTQAMVGGIGAVALVGLLGVYARLRSRLRAVGAIGEALLAAGGGESSTDALKVSPELGPEARAWNAILEEKEQFKKAQAGEAVTQALGNRRESKGDLEAACDAMSQGLLLIDDRMAVKYANGAASVFLGALKDKLIGETIDALVTEEKVIGAIRGIAAEGQRQRAVVEWQRPGQNGANGVLRFSVRPVRKEDGASAMVIIEDITQQRVAEEARNTFVAQATHELRTPLTNIRMYLETAIDEGEQDAAVRAKCFNVINQEARRLERIVGEMLSISEIEAGAFTVQRTDIYSDQLFKELREDYSEQAADKEIDLVFNLPPKMPVVKGDRDKIMIALHNLVGNALKYTPRGGKVTVNADVKQDKLIVDVTDTGFGIAEEEQERIFEKFYRATDPRVGRVTGTGLGLTLAREVVRLHGGQISVQSQLNKGSTFTLTLPSVAMAA